MLEIHYSGLNISPIFQHLLHFSNISNTDGASAKVREPLCIQLMTCIPQENTDNPPTQTIEPVLGFTPAEIRRAQTDPKLTVVQLLEIELC